MHITSIIHVTRIKQIHHPNLLVNPSYNTCMTYQNFVLKWSWRVTNGPNWTLLSLLQRYAMNKNIYNWIVSFICIQPYFSSCYYLEYLFIYFCLVFPVRVPLITIRDSVSTNTKEAKNIFNVVFNISTVNKFGTCCKCT